MLPCHQLCYEDYSASFLFVTIDFLMFVSASFIIPGFEMILLVP